MSSDISSALADWDYEPDRVKVRVIRGDDGREKIQMRIDLGLMQMDVDGRPDGERPEGRDSWFEYYAERQRTHDTAHPDSRPFLLEPEDCSRLLREGIQYYHRYLSFWHLQRYELCARDTSRNLRLFRFVREHARHDRDKLQFDQWRPYVTMMHARAVATPLASLGDIDTAIQAIDAGIKGIEQFLADYGQAERAGECPELLQLVRWRDELRSSQPKLLTAPPASPLESLRRDLANAVAAEQFEEAARLRDEIRRRLTGELSGERPSDDQP